MKVFISWSGRRSQYLAEALRGWLPKVIQALRPWMSDTDIGPGGRWLSEISRELNDSKIGIICVTPENQHSQWLLFEAGALSKTLEQTSVCPLLFDMQPSQLTGPLSQFQAQQLNKEGVSKVISKLSSLSHQAAMSDVELDEIFDVWWPRLDTKIKAAPHNGQAVEKRPLEDVLEELLGNSREQLRRESARIEHSRISDKRLEEMSLIFENLANSDERKEGQWESVFAYLQNLAEGKNPKDSQSALRTVISQASTGDFTKEFSRVFKQAVVDSKSQVQDLLSPPVREVDTDAPESRQK